MRNKTHRPGVRTDKEPVRVVASGAELQAQLDAPKSIVKASPTAPKASRGNARVAVLGMIRRTGFYLKASDFHFLSGKEVSIRAAREAAHRMVNEGVLEAIDLDRETNGGLANGGRDAREGAVTYRFGLPGVSAFDPDASDALAREARLALLGEEDGSEED